MHELGVVLMCDMAETGHLSIIRRHTDTHKHTQTQANLSHRHHLCIFQSPKGLLLLLHAEILRLMKMMVLVAKAFLVNVLPPFHRLSPHFNSMTTLALAD